MTTSQVDKPEVMLKAVIDKAVKNGWSFDKWLQDNWNMPPKEDFMKAHPKEDWEYFEKEEIRIIAKSYYVNILFDHSFAKAYWGDKRQLRYSVEGYCKDEECNTGGQIDEAWRIDEWQYHLQQAVLSENPLLYYFERL